MHPNVLFITSTHTTSISHIPRQIQTHQKQQKPTTSYRLDTIHSYPFYAHEQSCSVNSENEQQKQPHKCYEACVCVCFMTLFHTINNGRANVFVPFIACVCLLNASHHYWSVGAWCVCFFHAVSCCWCWCFCLRWPIDEYQLV